MAFTFTKQTDPSTTYLIWFKSQSWVWNTYFTVHKLVEAFRNRDYAAFTATLDEVENVSPQLFMTIKTFIKNRKLIQNMTSSTLSNGPTGGVNRKIKQIKRTAYGYRNWKNFVFRIQVEFKIRVKKGTPFASERSSIYPFYQHPLTKSQILKLLNQRIWNCTYGGVGGW